MNMQKETHNNIIEIIQTKNQLFLDNPDLFTKEISDAFSPIVDFKRIAKNGWVNMGKKPPVSKCQLFLKHLKAACLIPMQVLLLSLKMKKLMFCLLQNPLSQKLRPESDIEIVTSSNVYPGRYSMYLDEDGNWKIINIEINGMNLGKIFRNQFYSLMEKNNEDIDVVIEKWVASV